MILGLIENSPADNSTDKYPDDMNKKFVYSLKFL